MILLRKAAKTVGLRTLRTYLKLPRRNEEATHKIAFQKGVPELAKKLDFPAIRFVWAYNKLCV